MRHLVNHQSCEGAGHEARARIMHEQGQERYHETVCAEIGFPPGRDGDDGDGREHELRRLRGETR